MHESQFDPRDPTAEQVEPPVSISHVVHVLGAYRMAILFGLSAVALAYSIFALVFYLTRPALTTTSQVFRLDFEGASGGEYPNGMKFSSAEIVSAPILVRVFKGNHLDRFMTFQGFSNSIFVLESNRAYDQLIAEYEARLADPRLSSVDRERIEKDFAAKRDNLSKNEYSISFNHAEGLSRIPDELARKLLIDVLDTWARQIVVEQRVLKYQVSILSPDFIGSSKAASTDSIVNIQLLRSNIIRVIDSIKDLEAIPGSVLVRTPSRHMSLEEVRTRLDDIVRFEVEPLVAQTHRSILATDPGGTMRFVESQLAYDKRKLQERRDQADAIRQALSFYNPNTPGSTASANSEPRNSPQTGKAGNGAGRATETLMPQLSDGFLDRLAGLMSLATNEGYRQRLAEDYRRAALATIPAEQAVEWDSQLLDELRKPAEGVDAAIVGERLAVAASEVRVLVGQVSEIYDLVSRNLNPSTQLITYVGTPVVRTTRAASPRSLALWGLVVMLLALPISALVSLLHNRVREEDAGRGTMKSET